MAKKLKAVAMPRKVNRWMLVDVETGEIVDDAQDFGYRTEPPGVPMPRGRISIRALNRRSGARLIRNVIGHF